MNTSNPVEQAPSNDAPSASGIRPLRIAPLWVLLPLIPLARFGPALVEDGLSRFWMISVFGPVLCCLLIVLWWLFLSRARWQERVFGFLGLVGLLASAVTLADPTMRGAGTSYFTMPAGMLCFGIAALFLASSPPARRTGAILAATALGFALSLLIRTEGMAGNYVFDVHWRWTPTLDEKYMAGRNASNSAGSATATPKPQTTSNEPTNWTGFRGNARDGHALGSRISTNWTATPPTLLWKIPVGPGWSSFGLEGDCLVTQEQRGEEEAVVCYSADSGAQLWVTSIKERFDEPLGGPGPRATPAIENGNLVALGATGVAQRLDPATGKVLWTADLRKLADRILPMWGYSASPLLVGETVILYGGGKGSLGVFALDLATGAVRWSAPAGDHSYSSPQLVTIDGKSCVLLLTNTGLHVLDPQSGKVLLDYAWPTQNYRALQPLVTADGVILLPTPMNEGTRAIRLHRKGDVLESEDLWTSKNLKTDFSDVAALQGSVYGMDGGIFTCVDLKTGARQWKGGRYGKGQMVAVDASGVLLMAAESGDVVLIAADPVEHREIARFPAIHGKTWNHPVLIGQRLFVRNSEEAACYRMPLPN